MSWYRQYRPSSVSGLHLESVRTSLEEMMKSGRFPHALLFAGPKGTGKTSAARIISAMLNDPANAASVEQIFFRNGDAKKPQLHEPNPKTEIVERIARGTSFAVTEMDAASNRGIDDIRSLKERIFLPPQEGKVAVYILDEVHMLTTEAFNALLKVLEEPPQHVVFILATTELQKVPDTIVSRCTIVQFHKASHEELRKSLADILETEKISFDQEALDQVITLADGSFRDGVKYLETVAAGKKHVSVADVQALLHSSSSAQIVQFIDHLLQKDEKAVVAFFEELRAQGKNELHFHKGLLEFLHQDLLRAVGVSEEKEKYPKKISHFLLTQFQNLPVGGASPIPFLGLELRALEIVFNSKEKAGGSGSGEEVSGGKSSKPTTAAPKTAKASVKEASVSGVPPQISNQEDRVLIANVVPVIENVEELTEKISPITSSPLVTEVIAGYGEGQELLSKWDVFLEKVREKNPSLEAVLRSSRPLNGEYGKVKLEVYYQFHREQLQQAKFSKIIDQAVVELIGGKLIFEFSLAKQAEKGKKLSDVSGEVNEEDDLIQLAKEVLM